MRLGDTRPPLRVGAFAYPGTVGAPPEGGRPIFGMQQVSRAAHRAVLKHSTVEEIDFYTAPAAVPRVQDELDRAARGRERGPKYSCGEILSYFKSPSRVNAWFEVGGDSSRPFRARRRVQGHYPIALVHHTLSYGYLRHQWFLPLILEATGSDSVICTSASGKRAIENILQDVAEGFNREHGTKLKYKGRLDEIPLGIDADFFKPYPKTNARQRLNWSQDETVILWLGRLSAHDKADLVPLLEVFKKLLAEKPKQRLRLTLVGSSRGDEFQSIGQAVREMGLSERVTALPPRPDEDLPLLYSACDIFVSPVDSVQEMFGLTVVEAMSCGAAVICSDWGGYKDNVENGVTGVLVPTIMTADSTASTTAASAADDWGEWLLAGDELLDGFYHAQSVAVDQEALLAALRGLVDDPERRRVLGEAARASVLKRFDWPVVVGQWDGLLGDLPRVPESEQTTNRPYYRPRVGSAFSHYPTHLVEAETVLEVVPGAVLPKDYRPHMRAVDADRAREVLKAFAAVGGRSTVNAALDEDPESLRHALWLVKRGVLRVVQ